MTQRLIFCRNVGIFGQQCQHQYLLSLLFGTELLDIQVVLFAVVLAQLVLLQLSLQIQLLFPDLGPTREDLLQCFRHPGGKGRGSEGTEERTESFNVSDFV